MAEQEQQLRISSHNKQVEEECSQREHNRKMEEVKHKDTTQEANRGLNYAFIFGILFLILVGYVFTIGADRYATIALISVMAILIAIFVFGRKSYKLFPKKEPIKESSDL